MKSLKKLPDSTELFEWDFMQFEKWPPLADTIKVAKRAKPGHKIRTIGYLWVQVEEELAVYYAEKNQQGWMQEVQRMPVIHMRNKPKLKDAKENKKAKLAAAKAAKDKKKAEAKPKAEPKKKKKQDEPAGGASASPAPPEPLDAKATIAALKSDLNKYEQQAETARAKLEGTVGATKPKEKGICHHFGKGNRCTYGDRCNYLHCNPREDPFGCSHAFCKCTNTERAANNGETLRSPNESRKGKIRYELGCRRKTVLAPLKKTKGSSEGKTTKSASLVKKNVKKQKDYESFTLDVEWICDSGAGRVVWSDRALQEHGIPVKKSMRMRSKSKRPMCFDTGGGEVEANLSLLCESNLFGKREAYYLKDAP